MTPVCAVCKKDPDILPEYVDCAAEDGFQDVHAWVRLNEGTYNQSNGHFYCTDCYLELGCPNGVAP
jgi:hypothetical protein